MHTTHTWQQNFLRSQNQFVDTCLGSFHLIVIKEKRSSLAAKWKKIVTIPLKNKNNLS